MFVLIENLVAYVNNGGSNLHTCVDALNFIVSSSNLELLEPFDGPCSAHALSKVCQYAMINEKMYTSLSYTFIKSIQGVIQKCITLPKKFGKGKQTRDKACIDSKLRPIQLKTLVKMR
jgi:hypothetical protein